MCGSSKQQNDINKTQVSFMKSLQSQYQTDFGENQAILQHLTSSLQPIVNAGPSQLGYSANEKAALDTQAEEQAGQSYRQNATATNEAMAARGGGNENLTSGAADQIDSQIGLGAESQLASAKNNILQNDFTTGRQNYEFAVGGLSGASGSQESPLAGVAGSVNNAGNAAADEANTIQKTNFEQSPFNIIESAGVGLAGAALKGGI